MENEVAIELLNGMPLAVFMKWFIIAMAGALFYLIIRIIITLGPVGPKAPGWSWRHFFRGFLKLVATIFVSPLLILYFEDFAPILMEIFFKMGEPVGGEHDHVAVALNGASAFMMGFSIDYMTHKISKSKYFKNGK